jgi:hypothetical protein
VSNRTASGDCVYSLSLSLSIYLSIYLRLSLSLYLSLFSLFLRPSHTHSLYLSLSTCTYLTCAAPPSLFLARALIPYSQRGGDSRISSQQNSKGLVPDPPIQPLTHTDAAQCCQGLPLSGASRCSQEHCACQGLPDDSTIRCATLSGAAR